MQQRAAEEQAALVPAVPLTASPTAEGGISLTTSGGSVSPGCSPLPSGALPPSLLSWVIPRSEVEYQRRPNGELAVLGEGARWAVGAELWLVGLPYAAACMCGCSPPGRQ